MVTEESRSSEDFASIGKALLVDESLNVRSHDFFYESRCASNGDAGTQLTLSEISSLRTLSAERYFSATDQRLQQVR